MAGARWIHVDPIAFLHQETRCGSSVQHFERSVVGEANPGALGEGLAWGTVRSPGTMLL